MCANRLSSDHSPPDEHRDISGIEAARIHPHCIFYRFTNQNINTYLASGFYRFAKCPARWFAVEHVRYELVLCGVHDESAVFDVLPNAQKTQVPHPTFAQQTRFRVLQNGTNLSYQSLQLEHR